MKLTPVRTSKIEPGGPTLTELIDHHVPNLGPNSILAVSSKIVSICEGNTVPASDMDRDQLIQREADYYRDPLSNPYHITITIKDDTLIGSAGIDQSNGAGHYVLWPRNAQASADLLREHLVKRGINPVGIIVTDSRSTPMRRGVIGFGLAHSGFLALRPYQGQPDLFGRALKYEQASIIDGLAAAAGVVMGEGNEQTPLVIIEDVPNLEFQDRHPTPAESDYLHVPLEEDLYREAFERMSWDKRPPNR
jgi:F420-0:gamma-glutamyl ligase